MQPDWWVKRRPVNQERGWGLVSLVVTFGGSDYLRSAQKPIQTLKGCHLQWTFSDTVTQQIKLRLLAEYIPGLRAVKIGAQQWKAVQTLMGTLHLHLQEIYASQFECHSGWTDSLSMQGWIFTHKCTHTRTQTLQQYVFPVQGVLPVFKSPLRPCLLIRLMAGCGGLLVSHALMSHLGSVWVCVDICLT